MIKGVWLTFLIMVSTISMMGQSLDWPSVVHQANQGEAKSMYVYSYYSIYGDEYGIKKNYSGAVTMLQKLVAKTPVTDYIIMGYELLGDCYENGYGVNKNIATAKEWWQRAANNGSGEAKNKIEKWNTQKESQPQHDLNDGITISVGDISFKMIYVKGGEFLMGAQNQNNSKRNYDTEAEPRESPVHIAEIGSFYIGEVEVTQELWEAVMKYNNSENRGRNHPVENVSYYEAMKFCKTLSSMTGYKLTLPTEAQWEYAARGGNKSKGYKYSGSNFVDDVAWCVENSYGTSHEVAQKQPNELGIYDMSGNVWEWCRDWSADWGKSYNVAPRRNPKGDSSGTMKIFRGGSWNFGDFRCRVSDRRRDAPSKSFKGGGLRVIMLP